MEHPLTPDARLPAPLLRGGVKPVAAGGGDVGESRSLRPADQPPPGVGFCTVPAGNPDVGEPTSKRIQVSVTPLGAATAFETVTITTQRSTQVVGMY